MGRTSTATTLHASRNGRFAAVVNDFGHHGQILDLHTGAVTATLHSGDYRPDTVPFSFAFTEHQAPTVMVHRTAWNRLDITDAPLAGSPRSFR